MTDPREPNPFSFLDPPASTEATPSSEDAPRADANPEHAEPTSVDPSSVDSEQVESNHIDPVPDNANRDQDFTTEATALENELNETPSPDGFVSVETDGQATEEMEDEIHEEAEDEDADDEDEIDAPLPVPLVPNRPSWLGLLFFSEFAVIVLAGLLVLLQLWMYLPIVRNVAVGVALGWCLSKWPKKGFLNHAFLLLATVTGVVATYVLYLVLLFLYRMQAAGELSYWMQLSFEFQWDSFEYFVKDLLELPIFGYQLGSRGNLVMWSAEFFITFWVAWPMVRTAKQFAQLDSVPLEVLEHVISMRQDSCSTAEIRRELHSLGWLRPEDQNQALAAGDAFIRLMPKKKGSGNPSKHNQQPFKPLPKLTLEGIHSMTFELCLASVMICLGETPEATKIYHLRQGVPVDAATLVESLAKQDVVFLGEEHDNTAGHAFQLQMVEALHNKRPDLVLSLEMFERDVQGVVNDYLLGRLTEAEFLERSRPWSNYQQHYRPLIEFAKQHKLDVIASNIPRHVARLVSQGNTPPLEDNRWMPRTTSAPRDAYWERFSETMKGHAGTVEADAMDRYYRSQCLKDDTMAESISDYLAQHHHRQPLVVHLCGKFHSDFGQGTAWRLLSRKPLLSMSVVTMEIGDKPAEFDWKPFIQQGHFLVVVPPEPKSEKPSTEE